MDAAVIDAATHLIVVNVIYNTVKPYCHGESADENGLLLPEQPPCVLYNRRIKTLPFRIKHECIFPVWPLCRLPFGEFSFLPMSKGELAPTRSPARALGRFPDAAFKRTLTLLEQQADGYTRR
jgi:hypothetical protein